MLTITPIASSSKGNLYILNNGKSRLILEAGIPWKKMQQALDFDLSNVAGVMVSHGHGDHAKAVKDAARAGLELYMSAGTAQEIGATGHRIHHVKRGRPFGVDHDLKWRIMPFDVEHDAAEPLGFLISTGKEKICFITDSSYCRYRFKGITHLMIECNFDDEILGRNFNAGTIDFSRRKRLIESHMSLTRVKDFLRDQDTSCLKEIWLMHLSDANGDEVLFKSEIQKLTGLPVYVCGR